MISRVVTSSQGGVHPNLERTVRRHLSHESRAPRPPHAAHSWELLEPLFSGGRPIVLDAGCGTGDSTRVLADTFPAATVIGIDKSTHRLSKVRAGPLPPNLHLIRGDLTHLYPLMAEAGVTVHRHYILYPNPWPKPGHLLRRWHGHPAFPAILALGGELELRTNWTLYAEEFAAALNLAGHRPALSALAERDPPISPFERKYRASGQQLHRVVVQLPDDAAMRAR